MVERLASVHFVGDLRATSGGPSRSVTAVCDALAQAGSAVTLLTTELNLDEDLVRPRHPEVCLCVLTTNARGGLLRGHATPVGRSVVAAFEDTAGVAHTHGLWVPANRAAALAARQAGVPLVVSPKGMLSERALSVKRTKKRIGWYLYQRRGLQYATAFQATSEAEAKDIRRHGFHQPIAVIPHGVSLPPPPVRPDARDVRTALFLSRFHPIKGLPDLVEAWARVKPLGWRLLLVGPDEGGHRSEIERLVAERGLTDRIQFHQPVGEEEKQDVLREADLFVLPSHSENFGLVVAEALASGLPVLTTRGTPWQILSSERCGWWTDTGPDALSEALQKATATPISELRAMGARGRDYAKKALSWQRSGRDHLDLYRWLLGDSPRPSSIV